MVLRHPVSFAFGKIDNAMENNWWRNYRLLCAGKVYRAYATQTIDYEWPGWLPPMDGSYRLKWSPNGDGLLNGCRIMRPLYLNFENSTRKPPTGNNSSASG
jgi:hypothetical protein